jgi:hypothetical protein
MSTILETYADVVNEVLNYGFNDGPQVNRRRIERWVNEAQLQIARQVEATEFQATQAITLAKGVYKYTLPEGFLRAQDIYYPELQRRLRPVDLQQFDQTAPKVVEGPPSIYTIYGNELWFFPAPNGTGEELELRYIKRPPTLVAEADIPALNKDYLYLLVDYAASRAFEAEDDLEAANARMQRYKADLANFASDMQFQIVDRPHLVDGTWSSGAYSGRII